MKKNLATFAVFFAFFIGTAFLVPGLDSGNEHARLYLLIAGVTYLSCCLSAGIATFGNLE